MKGKSHYRVVLVISAVLSLLLAQTAFTADSVVSSSGDSVTLTLKDTDVRVALEALFRSVGKDFIMDPGIVGPVPALSFNNVSFETALKSIVKSAGLTYRVDDEIYIITKKPELTRTGSGPEPPAYTPEPEVVAADEVIIEKIPLNYSSASEILAIMNGDYDNLSYGSGGYGNGGYGSYGTGYGGYGSYGGSGSYPGSYGGYGSGSYGGGYSGGYPGGYSGNYGSYGGYGSSNRRW